MVTPSFIHRGLLILLLSAASYAVAHGSRLLMRREGRLKWTAGVLFAFLAFLVNRLALTGAGWLIFSIFFSSAPYLLVLLGVVGLASTPLLLSFVKMIPFFGPGVLRILDVVALLRLAALASAMLGMDWLGCLAGWITSWLLVFLASARLRWRFRSARWLAWTGVLGVLHLSPADVMAEMPGMKDAVREPTTRSVVPAGL